MPKGGARVSDELTEARTVGSRAKAALVRLEFLEGYREREEWYASGHPRDPQFDELRADLEKVVEIMKKWSREAMKHE